MAEEKKKPTYSYKGTDIDQDLLLTNITHNAESYAKYKGFDESKRREFFSALDEYINAMKEGRLSSVISGNIQDSYGILDNGRADWRDQNGKVLSQEEYESLSKRKKKKVTADFYANREVASFINAIAKGIYNAQSKGDDKDNKPAEKFDWNKHGLWNAFKLSLAPSGTGDLQAWLDLDPYDETTKKRGTIGRAGQLSTYISLYTQNLPENLDFSGTSFGSREQYIKALESLQQDLLNGVDSSDFRKLSMLGGTPNEYRSFFTTDETPLTQEERDAQVAAQQEQANIAALNALDTELQESYTATGYQIYDQDRTKADKLKKKINGSSSEERLQSFIDNSNAENISFDVAALQASDGSEYKDYIELYSKYNPEAFRTVSSSTYQGWQYIPGSLNLNDGSVLAYNPTTHQTTRLNLRYLGDDALSDYRNMIIELNDRAQTAQKPLFQEGGALPTSSYQQSLNAIQQFDQAQRARSEVTKSDPKLRQPWKKENAYSDTSGLTATDYARLGSIAADIAALIDPEPFSALGLGVASDVTNLYADIQEGQGFWNTAGNFVGNLGLSALGVIPIFGDALGSGTKVVKSFVKLAPKVSKLLVASGLLAGISNSDEIIKSISKIGKDGVENEMTMQDWRNIALGIQLILGGANASRNVKAAKKVQAAKKSSITDHMDVRVKDASGNEKVLRFGGPEDVKALRKAQTPDEVNKIIKGHESYKNYEVATDTQTGHSWFTDKSKWYKPWSWRQETSTAVLGDAVSPVYDQTKFLNTGALSGRRRYMQNAVTNKTPDVVLDKDAITALREQAKAYRQTLKVGRNNRPVPGTAHSNEFKEIVSRRMAEEGITDPNSLRAKAIKQEEIAIGLWKEGGLLRYIQKGQTGLRLKFNIPEWKPITFNSPFHSGEAQVI